MFFGHTGQIKNNRYVWILCLTWWISLGSDGFTQRLSKRCTMFPPSRSHSHTVFNTSCSHVLKLMTRHRGEHFHTVWGSNQWPPHYRTATLSPEILSFSPAISSMRKIRLSIRSNVTNALCNTWERRQRSAAPSYWSQIQIRWRVSVRVKLLYLVLNLWRQVRYPLMFHCDALERSDGSGWSSGLWRRKRSVSMCRVILYLTG